MAESSASARTRRVVEAHFRSFNDHDSAALLAGVDPAIIWSTGRDVIHGRDQPRCLDDWLWSLQARLEVVHLVVDGAAAAAECVEHLVIDGASESFPIAVFFTVRDDLLATVKVFREGTADVGTDPS